MKKLNKLALWSVVAVATMLGACQDNSITGEIDYPEENLSRLFSPIEFTTITPIIDGYELEWSTVKDAEGYYLQFSEDSLFNEGDEAYYAAHPNIVRNVYADTVQSHIGSATIIGLGAERDLFIRVAAFATGKEQSHWLVSDKSYKTLDRPVVIILKEVDRNEVYTTEATISWYVDSLANNPMDQLIYKVNGTTEEVTIDLDAATQQAGYYTLTGLQEGTTYLVRGHNSAFAGLMGDYNEVAFKTKSGAGDAIVYDGVENFNDLIARLPNGSTIYIPAGMTVTLISTEGNPSNVAITKDITIRGESAANGKATISFKEMRLYGDLSSVTLENLKIVGESGWSYVVNLKDEGENKFIGCGELNFIDCEITGYGNAIIRHQAAEGTGLGRINMDNCYVHNMNPEGSNSYAMFMFKNADYYVEEFVITNSTFYNIGTNIIEHRSVSDAGRNCNATVRNCTFHNCGKNSRYMFDFQNVTTGNFTLENNVFGATMDPTKYQGYRGANVTTSIVNTFAANDFLFVEGKAGIMGDIPTFEAGSAEIFVDAENGNFTLTGAAAAHSGSIGDPRWW